MTAWLLIITWAMWGPADVYRYDSEAACHEGLAYYREKIGMGTGKCLAVTSVPPGIWPPPAGG